MNEKNDCMGILFEEVAMRLVDIGTDDFGEKEFEGCKMGDLLHLRLRNMKGEVCLQVVGADSLEIAEQLVLSCFHNISIEHLGALQLHPLNRGLQVRKEKE